MKRVKSAGLFAVKGRPILLHSTHVGGMARVTSSGLEVLLHGLEVRSHLGGDCSPVGRSGDRQGRGRGNGEDADEEGDERKEVE